MKKDLKNQQIHVFEKIHPTTMKLSIITVNLNNRDGLKKTIDSVVSQTFSDFEWIVIDGGSTDGSKELIEEYSSRFAYWVSEPDKGIYNGMNKGVRKASGDYLQFLNSGDSLSSPNVLSSIFSTEYTADILYGNILIGKSSTIHKKVVFPDTVSYMYMVRHSLPHPSSFIKRKLLLDNPYDESLRIVSDWKFYLQAIISNKTFCHLDIFVSVFDTNGISSTNHELVQKERLRIINELCPTAVLEDKEIEQKLEARLANTPINDFTILCEKHPFLKKIITFVILLMKKKQ